MINITLLSTFFTHKFGEINVHNYTDEIGRKSRSVCPVLSPVMIFSFDKVVTVLLLLFLIYFFMK